MAFYLHTDDKGANAPVEYLPAGAGSYTPGLALTQSAGLLAAATGTTAPSYISCFEGTLAAGGEEIPVVRVNHDQIWATTWAAAATAIKLGNKVTLHTDGGQVTATTTNGVAEVVGMDGTAVGDTCYVRF